MEAQERMNALQAEYLRYVQVRADAIRALRRGHSQAQIGAVLGISKQAVANASRTPQSVNAP
jgi:predicted transcriptional regulator